MQDQCNILIIDDEVLTLKMTKVGLERLGYQVAIFSKPSEAVTYFEKNNKLIELVITDKNMPQISGMEIIERFKKINPNIPIFILTGFIQANEDEQLKSLGATKNLLKPISLKELAAEIDDVIGL